MRFMVVLMGLVIFLSTGFSGTELHAADNIYQLVSIEEKADFDYKLLDGIDGLTPPYPEGSSFMIGDIPTKKGKSRIFRFIAPFISENHEQPGKMKVFHNLIAIGADKDLNITDAWHYTLEWQDNPSQRLYRLGNKELKLTRYLDVKKLAMVNAAGESLESTGILDDCFASRRHFPEAQVEAAQPDQSLANEAQTDETEVDQAQPDKTAELILNPEELCEDKDQDQILFQPGSGIKQTAYTTYVFAKDEFEAKVGKLPLKKACKIKVEILETESSNYDPDNPMVQKPIGGFDLTRHLCGIVSVEY